ncbi:type II secretion system protein [Alicyclobacillus dauci]|uniref:Type II secretion system GspH family protein n=1 Tax=Alicyclobacillus dauci TaxID=1475485 RepID=A0ABY6Z8C6_9BACL|nr:type II secretion system protein [Alicyclobacillus dauci]WAH38980.1 type II secretion system GspH family protein [Alicyclobacillus dauci]
MQNTRLRPQRDGAFSLLELMVAVAIVAIMVGVLTPHLMGATEQARQTACDGNTKTISAALAEYNLMHFSLPSGDTNAQLTALVANRLLDNSALTGHFTIDDVDPNNTTVSCASTGGNNES